MIQYEDLRISGKELGRGGFGVVYKGSWRMTDVAVKELLLTQLTDATLHEFEAEANTMKALRHPNIVAFYGYCTRPKYCIVMEYMPQGSLYNILHNLQADITWEVRLRIASDITRGLVYLHAENIVHRDIKSMNVLLNEHSKACLADFGLARVKTETLSVTSRSSQAAGTVRWMAPELFKRRAVYTRKSDMYSLGITLWELASRKIPFQDSASNDVVPMWVKDGEREDIPEDCPAKLASVIKVCWDGDPGLRPDAQDVAEFLMSDGDLDLADILSSRRSASVSQSSGFSYASNLASAVDRKPVSRGGRRSRAAPLPSPIAEAIEHSSGSGPITSASPPSSSSNTKPLELLTEEELDKWLTAVKLQVVIPKLKEHCVNGETLAMCETIEELIEFGCITGHARVLFKKIQEAKSSGGVSLSSLSPPPADSPTDAAPSPVPAPAPSPASPGKSISPSYHFCCTSLRSSAQLLPLRLRLWLPPGPFLKRRPLSWFQVLTCPVLHLIY